MVNDLHAAVEAGLRRAGLHYTPGRRVLVQAIIDADRPLTASELSSGRPALKQSTTYRNLFLLERSGVVHRVLSTDDYARFELSEEFAGHHHHLVCMTCGGLEDFTPPPRFERSLEAVMGAVSISTGFRAEAHRLDLLGVCGTCRP